MQLTGTCNQCGQTHTLALSATPEDAGHMVELSAGDALDSSGTIAASPELIKALTEAGALICPATPKGRTVGYGGPNTIYT